MNSDRFRDETVVVQRSTADLALAFDMRCAAALLIKISSNYDLRYYTQPEYRKWSPEELLTEADYLESS